MSEYLKNNSNYLFFKKDNIIQLIPQLKALFKLNMFSFYAEGISELKDINRYPTQELVYRNAVLLRNLIMLDDMMPKILLALAISADGRSSLMQFITKLSKTSYPFEDIAFSKKYLEYKFVIFLETMLYADLFHCIWHGELHSERLYVFRDNSGKLNFYYNFQIRPLLKKLLSKINIKVTKQVDHYTLNFQLTP
jgi:hypothetical protein